MDFNLTDVQRSVHDQALELARQFSLDYWRERDRTASYPDAFLRVFAEQGWMGTIVPEDYGGAGLGVTEASLLLHAICLSGAGTSGASAVHFAIFPSAALISFGSVGMRQRNLPGIASGEIACAFGVTEPTAGTDTSRISTKATRVPGGWSVSGQKIWTTNAQHATKIMLLARTSPREDERPLDGLTLFFTDLDRRHCDIRPIEKLGRAAVDSNEVFIDGLQVPDDDVVGKIGQGFRPLLHALNPERILIAMEAVGIGRSALNMAVRYANERVVFNRPIGANQAISHPLAQSWAELEAAELLALKAATRFDQGLPCANEANAAKYLAAEAGFRACDAALQTFGGLAYARDFHVERLWREIRLYRLAPISQEMLLNQLSTHALGLPRPY